MNQLKYILCMLPVLLMLGSCEKDVEPKAPSIGMKLAEPVRKGRTYVQLKGSLSNPASVKEAGFIWWKQGDAGHPSEIACRDSIFSGVTALLEGLKPGISYEYCMFAGNGTDRLTSETGSFATVVCGEPLLAEPVAGKDAPNRLTCRVKDDGIADTGKNLSLKGFCWNTKGNPTIEDEMLEVDGETEDAADTFTASIPGLQDTTTYYIRAFAENDSSYLSYSPEIKIVTGKTLPKMGEIILADTLEKAFAATLEDAGGSAVLSKGFCWNTSGMPTVDDNRKEAGEDFIATLTELDTHALYYVRAFAENTYGIAYSPELTVQFISVPLVGSVERIDPESSEFRSAVTDDGGSEITEKGFCWNTTGSPSLADHVVKAGKDFVATIPEMESGTYYIRAFAVNKAGVGYGKELSISIQVITVPEPGEVRILDEDVYLLKSSVLSTGGSAIAEMGFCWSTHDYPDLSDHVLAADDDFTATLGVLDPGIYYIRAYASNKAGTGYGRTFRLDMRSAPVVDETYAVAGASANTYRAALISNGGSSIKEWGFCYNTTGRPTLADDTVEADADFSATIDNLPPGEYHIRAYAINDIGVGYGKEMVVSVDKLYITLDE